MPSEFRFSRTIPVNDSWDVIVAGGGPAGVAAATASAREGARTLLIEATGALGGMGTQGLVPWFCGYTDGKRIIACGLAEHVRSRLAGGMPHLRESYAGNPLREPAIDSELLKRIYDDMATSAGAEVLFHTCLAAVEKDAQGEIDALILANKAGLSACRAKVYVDCTGDGDLAAWAGAPFEKGDADGNLQPATACFVLANVEPYDCWHNPQQSVEDVSAAAATGGTVQRAPSLHFYDPNSPVHKAVASKEYPLIIDVHSCSMQIGYKRYGYNFGHVYDVDNTDPVSVSKALITGRKQALQYLEAFAEYHPAFAGASLVATGALLGVRETRRILGDYVLTVDDYLARRSFPDEICRNAYMVDVHGKVAPEIKKKIEAGEKALKKGTSYGVPYRCLTPRALRNVLVAGRCISTDRQANGSIRIMACCLTTGEAAGLAASMAAASAERDVHTVDTARLRARLIEHGAYLPRAADS